MISRTLLSPDELTARLPSGWSHSDGFLQRTFEFPDFGDAWGWMNEVAEIAHQLDHHPNWSNVYNKVDVSLQTHDAGGVTALDMLFAERVNELNSTP
jgi:4a-hydroxytetrahydrobiopterin dehydratase